MPVLYHYTCAANLKGILREGVILKSKILSNTKELVGGAAVCLTSDPLPDGHGLPDGTMYVEDTVNIFLGNQYHQLLSHNHMAFRLTITIPENEEKLVSAKRYYQNNPSLITGLELSAYFTNKKEPTDTDLFRALVKLGDGTIARKANTWHYYFDDIPSVWINSVGVLKGDSYLEESLEHAQEVFC